MVAKSNIILGTWGSLLKVAEEQDFHFVLLYSCGNSLRQKMPVNLSPQHDICFRNQNQVSRLLETGILLGDLVVSMTPSTFEQLRE